MFTLIRACQNTLNHNFMVHWTSYEEKNRTAKNYNRPYHAHCEKKQTMHQKALHQLMELLFNIIRRSLLIFWVKKLWIDLAQLRKATAVVRVIRARKLNDPHNGSVAEKLRTLTNYAVIAFMDRVQIWYRINKHPSIICSPIRIMQKIKI